MRKSLLALLLLASFAFAQNNQADSSFGTDGMVALDFGTHSKDVAYDGVRSNGGTLLVGDTAEPNQHGVIARFISGGLDAAFGDNGRVLLQSAFSARAIKIQADGKILIGGMGNVGIFVSRLNADGSFDTSFGTAGTFTYYGPTDALVAYGDMELAADGSIFLTGTGNQSGSSTNLYIAKLTSSGTFDTSFDTDGIAYSSPGNFSVTSNAMALQPDGKIVVCGSVMNAANVNWLVARYTAAGVLDTTFNSTGYNSFSYFENPEVATCLLLQPDGKIAVGGTVRSDNTPTTVFAIARFTITGQLDLDFSSDGKTYNGYFGQNATATSLLIDATGNLYIGGTVYRFGSYEYQVLRYSSAGVRDQTFGNNGAGYFFFGGSETDEYGNFMFWYPSVPNPYWVIGGASANKFHGTLSGEYTLNTALSLDEGSDGGRDIDRLSDGSYISSGFAFDGEAGFDRVAISKHLPDGSLDTSFLNGGKIICNNTQTEGFMTSQVLQPDGNIIVASGNYMTRILPNGSPDSTFGTMGEVFLPELDFYGHDIGVDDQGRIIYIGHGEEFAIKRFNADGSPDINFGDNGHLNFDFYGYPDEFIIQPDGKILMSGFRWNDDFTFDSVVTRVNTDGTPDASFGSGGVYAQSFDLNDIVTSFELLPDGKILIAVYKYEDDTSALARLNANGTLDTTFGTGGMADPVLRYAEASVIDNSGRLLLAGPKIKRYDLNGNLDITFGDGGEIDMAPYQFGVETIKIDPDNKIVVVGDGSQTYRIGRFMPDSNMGTIDFTTNESIIYPNPVENSTTFKYELSKSTDISVALYDLNGKEVAQYLKNKNQSAGAHELPVEMPLGLASGHYILKISSGEGSNSIKLIKK